MAAGRLTGRGEVAVGDAALSLEGSGESGAAPGMSTGAVTVWCWDLYVLRRCPLDCREALVALRGTTLLPFNTDPKGRS